MTTAGQANSKNISGTMSAENRISNRRKGILFILLAAFFFSLMSVFVRLSGDVPTMQKAFFRNIVAAVVAVIILLRSKTKISLKKENLPPLLLRSVFGTIGILANFWAVDNLGIADANMLNKLSPFFAILMSIFILGEKPNRIEWLSVILAFIGAAFVAKPSAGIVSLPALVGILGGFSFCFWFWQAAVPQADSFPSRRPISTPLPGIFPCSIIPRSSMRHSSESFYSVSFRMSGA